MRRGFVDELCTSRDEIYRFDLIDHDKSCEDATLGDLDMKRNLSVGICKGADKSQAGSLIKKVVADDKSRPTASLLVSRLRIKCQCSKIAFAGSIMRLHHVSLPLGLPHRSSEGL